MSEITPENPSEPRGETITEAWGYLLRHPELFIKQWNYKGAVMSGAIRAPFFFFTFLAGNQGLKLAIAVSTVQFVFRFLFAGIGGALIQALRRVEPPWKAIVSILVVVPVISHIFEILIQIGFAKATGSESVTLSAILKSICVSVFSALFTLYIMRRDILIVGEGASNSLWQDFAEFPRLIFDFLAFVPNQLADMVRRGAYLAVALSFAGWAVFSQIIVAAFYKPQFSWTWKGQQVMVLKYYMVCACILMGMAVTASLIKGRVKKSSQKS